jgi:hypothetical protein
MSATEKPTADSGTQAATPNIQGEGDYESARKYRNDTDKFLKEADVSGLARSAAPKSPEEAQELKQAEDVGLSHVKRPAGTKS